MACRDEDRVSRLTATIDALYGKDNSSAIEQAFEGDLTAQLNYSGRHAEIRENTDLKPAKTTGWKQWVTGDISSMAHRPSEILGDDVVRPVLKAYQKYSEALTGEKNNYNTNVKVAAVESRLDPDIVLRLKEDSGLLDAMDDALDLIDERFAEGTDRRLYAENWVRERIQGAGRRQDEMDGVSAGVNRNLSRNLLMNNIRAGMLNWTQTAMTTLPEFGFSNTKKGMDAYFKAVKEKSPELDNIGGGRFETASEKWDFFNSPESFNQGIAYFAGKEKALAAGKSQAQAIDAGKKAIEQTQFKSELGNEPEHYWKPGGVTRLSLMSYAIQMKRLHSSWINGILDGIKTNNKEKFQQNAKALLYFTGANMLINGPSSGLTAEGGALLKAIAPQAYEALRDKDQYSIMGLLDADTAELTRIPLTNLGFLLNVPVLFDFLGDTWQAGQRLVEHPDKPKNWIKAFQKGSMLAPPVPVIGNKNLGNLVEYTYRSLGNDWEKYTWQGKKYESNPVIEAKNLFTGKSARLEREANKKRSNSSSGGIGSIGSL